MVNVLSLAAAASTTSIAILDHTQTYAVDLTNTQCIDYAPVEQFMFHRTGAEAWKLNAVANAANQFQVENIACSNILTYAGSVTGTIPTRSQTVVIAGSNTTWNIASVNATNPTGPYRFIESVSGKALTAWANDPDQDSNSSPFTLENNRPADERQVFWFTKCGLSLFLIFF
ncbi:hypothetical protein K435DRAFT_779795 [Dendrothele bispora CBS 962.96]|uniref:Ricin B lectin domain-containing protein n=1 Tax=Dendrothele bispora (strain CBS 962.96) TaxID=1314807 RepID=A0A4S8LVX5_DENBC|nr:hypothetical protein K435DRAFT_779795 [Dendrothele bispora CBS 962.96]